MLLIGESGTGKELIARLIHELDARDRKARARRRSTARTIVPELSGSEFFGHERGAFTGAVAARDGAFALADGGTLFLDEVGELPLPLQAQLLRVVQERTYKRVGGNAWQRTEFRLVCATNRDLPQCDRAGRIPQRSLSTGSPAGSVACRRCASGARISCRSRGISWRALRPDAPALDFDAPVRDYLLSRAYPGNVRDLRQLVARIAIATSGRARSRSATSPRTSVRSIGAAPRRLARRRTSSGRSGRRSRCGVGAEGDQPRRGRDRHRASRVDDENGNLQRAARRLGVTDRALQMRRAAAAQNGSGDDHDAK